MPSYLVTASPGQLWMLALLVLFAGMQFGASLGILAGNATTKLGDPYHKLTTAQLISFWFCVVTGVVLLGIMLVFINTQGWVLDVPKKN
jgi:uncharacterized BrkB/YihY/UPF0761 family membrane protein